MSSYGKTRERSLHEIRSMVLRRKMGIKDAESENQSSSEIYNKELMDLIRGKLSVKECLRYVKDPNITDCDSKLSDEICYCGQKQSCHISDQFIDDAKMWDEQKDIQQFQSSNAFGQILFKDEHSSSRKPSYYVRTTDPKDVFPDFLKLLDFWNLFNPFPSLAVAVIGGAKQLKLDNKSLQKFSHGLVKVASSTNAWIITEGHNYGIPRLVGNVIRDGQTLSYDESDSSSGQSQSKIRCIGIAMWGRVKHRENLIISEKKRQPFTQGQRNIAPSSVYSGVTIKTGPPAHPKIKLSSKAIAAHVSDPVRMYSLQKPSKGEIYLNPDHSHFVLIDDGYRGSKCRKDLRLTFPIYLLNKLFGMEKLDLSASMGEDSARFRKPVPSVVVVINGGLRVITAVRYCVSMSVPVVICKNSGRAADIFAAAYEIITDLRNSSEVPYEDPEVPKPSDESFALIRSKITNTFFKDKAEASNISILNGLTKKVFESVQREQMVTVFDLGSNLEFDSVILSALFKVRDRIKPQDQMRLALTWDRSDIAEEKIFSMYTWQEIEGGDDNFFKNVMDSSLLNSKLGFVSLLISLGFSINEYLTGEVLLKLYEESFKSDKSMKQLHDKFSSERKIARAMSIKGLSKKTVAELERLNTIFHFISSLVSYQIPRLIELSEAIENPYRELFIWAILFNRLELAKFFWRKMDHPVMTALMGAYLVKSLMTRTSMYETDRMDDYTDSKDYFESLATDVINKCGLMDDHMTSIVLSVRHSVWRKTTCMDAAAQADCKRFLGSMKCQDVLNERWLLRIRSPGPIVALGVIFFPLVPLLIQFDSGQSVSGAIWLKITRLLNLYKWSRIEDVGLASDPTLHTDNSSSAKKERQMTRMRHQYSTFFRAPITKFCFSTIMECLFLALYSYFLLFGYHEPAKPVDKPLEYLLHAWVFTLLCEVFRAIYQTPPRRLLGKFAWWSRSIFNCTDGVALLLYIIAFILRMLSEHHFKNIEGGSLYDDYSFAAKAFFSFAMFLFFVRLLSLLNVSTSLGPQLIMVGNMLMELGNFLMLLFLFLMAFGIYHSAILNQQNLSGNYLNVTSIPAYSFWPFVSGPDITEIEGADGNEASAYQAAHCFAENSQCSNSTNNTVLAPLLNTTYNFTAANWSNTSFLSRQVRSANMSQLFSNESIVLPTIITSLDDNSSANATANSPTSSGGAYWFLTMWLTIWTLLSFLLVNLLIAIFSNVYDEISKNSSEIWKYYQYQLITEFESMPILPAPLSFLVIIWRIVAQIVNYCKKKYAEKSNKMNALNDYGESGLLAEQSVDQSRHIGNDPVLQFEREAQTAVYRDQKRARIANSITQLDDIHSQLSTIAESIARLSRLETVAEQVVIEAAGGQNQQSQTQSQWQILSKARKSDKDERQAERVLQSALLDGNDEVAALLSGVSTKPDVLPESVLSVEKENSSLTNVSTLEGRVDLLTERLKSMQRISSLLTNAVKSSFAPNGSQSLQPLKPVLSPSINTNQPLVPPLPLSSTVLPKSQDKIFLPVAGVGLTAVPRPLTHYASKVSVESTDASRKQQSDPTKNNRYTEDANN